MAKPDRVFTQPPTSSKTRVTHMVDGSLNYAVRVETVEPTSQLEIAPGVYQHLPPDGGQVTQPAEPRRLENATMRVTSTAPALEPQEQAALNAASAGGAVASPEEEAGLASAKALSESGKQASQQTLPGTGASRVVNLTSARGGAADPSRFFPSSAQGAPAQAGADGRLPVGTTWNGPDRNRIKVIPTPPGIVTAAAPPAPAPAPPTPDTEPPPPADQPAPPATA